MELPKAGDEMVQSSKKAPNRPGNALMNIMGRRLRRVFTLSFQDRRKQVDPRLRAEFAKSTKSKDSSVCNHACQRKIHGVSETKWTVPYWHTNTDLSAPYAKIFVGNWRKEVTGYDDQALAG